MMGTSLRWGDGNFGDGFLGGYPPVGVNP